jgi:hypothetical protein
MISMLIHVSDWLAAHNDWSGWFATVNNSFSPMCSLNFSFMGGVGKQAHWYLNFDVTHWYLCWVTYLEYQWRWRCSKELTSFAMTWRNTDLSYSSCELYDEGDKVMIPAFLCQSCPNMTRCIASIGIPASYQFLWLLFCSNSLYELQALHSRWMMELGEKWVIIRDGESMFYTSQLYIHWQYFSRLFLAGWRGGHLLVPLLM